MFHGVPRRVEFGYKCPLILVSKKQLSESFLNSKGFTFLLRVKEVWSGWGLGAFGGASLEHNKSSGTQVT